MKAHLFAAIAVVLFIGVGGCQVHHKPMGPRFTAQPDMQTTTMGTPVEVDVLRNDAPRPAELKLVKIASNPSGGRVAMHEPKGKLATIVYTPAGWFHGDDHFSYVVQKGKETAEGKVTVHVAQRGHLHLQARIDHREMLYIRGSKLWFSHLYDAPPTDVKVNGRDYQPMYGMIENYSAPSASSPAPVSPSFPTDHDAHVEASGMPCTWPACQLVVDQQPSSANDYTTIIKIVDPQRDSHVWDIDVSYDAE